MKIFSLAFLSLSLLIFIQCDDSVSGISSGKNPPPIPTPEVSKIIQVADTINGKQGESTRFELSDYFESDAEITIVEFSSSFITIEDVGNKTYELSQPDSITGEQIITGLLVNEDTDTLNAELIYSISSQSETDTTSAGSDTTGTNDPGTDDPDDDDPNSDDPDDDDPNSDDPDDEGPKTDSTHSELVIMPLGDSITNDGRSRIKLWYLLEDDGYKIDYVGDQEQRNELPDHDHEGVGGITIQRVADKAESLMKRHNPEFVFLMIGTNDIAWYFDETGQEIADRWNDLVQLIFDSSDPGVFLIAATIPPVTSKNNGSDKMEEKDRAVIVKEYNEAVREHVKARLSAGDNIVLADVEAALTIQKHVSSDGVHLNEAGYHKMGTVYYEAIKSILE